MQRQNRGYQEVSNAEVEAALLRARALQARAQQKVLVGAWRSLLRTTRRLGALRGTRRSLPVLRMG
ncbi:MAG: hypothetical protein AAFY02_09545 [Pseudomonadota bacterium]